MAAIKADYLHFIIFSMLLLHTHNASSLQSRASYQHFTRGKIHNLDVPIFSVLLLLPPATVDTSHF